MARIHDLSIDVVSQIAAGEVIERPAYCVKELVENSIDAQATSITIHIEKSGLANITVIDNGCGMEREDMERSFLPHTTSKIHTIEDLQTVHTLGFRGEALSSIAAMSTLTISSKPKESPIGTSILIKGGNIASITPVGMPVGTKIVVSHLFSSVPARKKFLKSLQTEYRHILEVLFHIVLAYPQIHFHFSHNKKAIFDLPNVQDKKERFAQLFGNEIASQLIPLTYEDAYVRLEGYITRPQAAYKSFTKQFVYINQRSIIDRAIALQVKSTYGTLLERHANPLFIFFITMQPELVDINVHPRKEEARLFHKEHLLQVIRNLVGSTLAQEQLHFTHDWGKTEDLTHSYAGMSVRDEPLDWVLPQITLDDNEVLQVEKVYMVFSQPGGVVIVDQHAAHERILFEQYKEVFLKKLTKKDIYKLPESVLFEVSVLEKALLEEYGHVLGEYGFMIEHYKGNQFVLCAVPLLFHDRAYKPFLLELLKQLSEGGKKDIDALSHTMLAYLACKSAVKAGDVLEKEQMRELLRKLQTVSNNATCPHGRPTKVLVSTSSLERMFRRK